MIGVAAVTEQLLWHCRNVAGLPAEGHFMAAFASIAGSRTDELSRRSTTAPLAWALRPHYIGR